MITKERLIQALKETKDPEIGLDIYTLGLVYETKITGDEVYIKMTFTTPLCPYGPALMQETEKHVQQVTGAKKVKIEITFDPPWQPSEEVKMMRGI